MSDVFDLLRLAEFHEEGSYLDFPHMEKKEYNRAKKALAKLGCTWNKRRGVHTFDHAMTTEIWERLLERRVLPKMNKHSYFPTPPKGVEHVRLFAEDYINPYRKNLRILEPSAGSGAMVDMMIALLTDHQGNVNPENSVIDVVELQPHMAEMLQAKYKEFDWINVFCSAFEDFEPTEKYDAVVMNPPFSNSLYAKHILRAAELTKDKGCVVFVAPLMFGTLTERGCIRELQQMMSDSCGFIESMDTTHFDGTATKTVVGVFTTHCVIPTELRLGGLAHGISGSVAIPSGASRETFKRLVSPLLEEEIRGGAGRFFILTEQDWTYLMEQCVVS